jgi:hypothetical protein
MWLFYLLFGSIYSSDSDVVLTSIRDFSAPDPTADGAKASAVPNASMLKRATRCMLAGTHDDCRALRYVVALSALYSLSIASARVES